MHIENQICDTAEQRLGATETQLSRVLICGDVQHYLLRGAIGGRWHTIGRAKTREALLQQVEIVSPEAFSG